MHKEMIQYKYLLDTKSETNSYTIEQVPWTDWQPLLCYVEGKTFELELAISYNY